MRVECRTLKPLNTSRTRLALGTDVFGPRKDVCCDNDPACQRSFATTYLRCAAPPRPMHSSPGNGGTYRFSNRPLSTIFMLVTQLRAHPPDRMRFRYSGYFSRKPLRNSRSQTS